jgi:hypothetical protein
MARKGKIACVYVKPESSEVWAVFLAQLKIWVLKSQMKDYLKMKNRNPIDGFFEQG